MANHVEGALGAGDSGRIDLRPGWAIAFAASLLLYGLTANRGVQWADSTHFMYRIVHGDVTGTLGLALAHPLHHWLGRLAVAIAGPQPVYITWVSSVFGAITIANVYGCVAALVGRSGPAIFAAGSLAVASTFWRVSTITEVYTLSAALLAGTCWCLVLYVRDRRPNMLALGCLLNGFGGANDLQSGLTMLVLVALTLIELRARRLTLLQASFAALAYLVGVMPYGALVIGEWVRTGDFVATVRSALFGTMWADAVLGGGLSRRVLLVDIAYPLLNFPNLLLPAAAFGLWQAKRFGVDARLWRTLGAILAIQAVFALRYDVVEQYNFFIPMYVLLVVFAGIGAAAFTALHPDLRIVARLALVLLVATPGTYEIAKSIARSGDVLHDFARHKPYRDDYEYLMTPWTVVEDSAERMSRQALALLGEDGLVVFEDHMAHYCIAYQAMLEGRGEPRAIPDRDPRMDAMVREALIAGKHVVLVPWDRDHPRSAPPLGHWQREGDLYVLAP